MQGKKGVQMKEDFMSASDVKIPPKSAASDSLSQEIGEIRNRAQPISAHGYYNDRYKDTERLIAIVEELQKENEELKVKHPEGYWRFALGELQAANEMLNTDLINFTNSHNSEVERLQEENLRLCMIIAALPDANKLKIAGDIICELRRENGKLKDGIRNLEAQVDAYSLQIQRIAQERDHAQERLKLAEKVVEAARDHKTWFLCLSYKQNKLLVENQTLESASANWEAATNSEPLDYGPLLHAFEAYEAARAPRDSQIKDDALKSKEA